MEVLLNGLDDLPRDIKETLFLEFLKESNIHNVAANAVMRMGICTFGLPYTDVLEMARQHGISVE